MATCAANGTESWTKIEKHARKLKGHGQCGCKRKEREAELAQLTPCIIWRFRKMGVHPNGWFIMENQSING